MNKFIFSSLFFTFLLMASTSVFAQNELDIRNKRIKTTTTTTTTINSPQQNNRSMERSLQKDSFTLINGQSETHNFGNNLKVSVPVEHTFMFKNNGTEPIQISGVSTSCGCTTPEWSNNPVKPGEEGKVTVRYNSAAVGRFNKSVTLTFTDKSTKTLYVQGEVVPGPK